MAKNLTDFIPGMSNPSEMIDKCEFLWTATHNPGDNRAHNYGNGCHRMCWQSNHSYQGSVSVKIFGAGGATGGACCCSLSTPGASGTYAFFDVTPVQGEDNAFCWHQYIGGCCVPGFTSGSGCYIWFKDPARSAGCINFSPGWCAPSLCSAPQADGCWCVCYQSGRCRDDLTPFNGVPAYDCRNCFEQAGTIASSEFWLDSEVTMFPKVHGFIATSECGNTGGSNVCTIVQFKNFPAVANGKKEHFYSQSFGGENCYGGWLSECQTCYWFGSRNGDASSNYASVCTAGIGGTGASSNGGNCYCGGPDHGGIFVSFMYTLNSEIEG